MLPQPPQFFGLSCVSTQANVASTQRHTQRCFGGLQTLSLGDGTAECTSILWEDMMKRLKLNNLWPAVVLPWLMIACAGSESEGDAAKPAAAPDVAVAARPNARAYPYLESNGVLVCGERQVPGFQGQPGIESEWYPVDTMNRHLENAGSADGVAHVTLEFRSALRREGISRVETCAHAREYVRLNRELSEIKTQPQPATSAEPGAFEQPSGDDLVDKILNGQSFDNPPSVGLWIDPTRKGDFCTGQLIGPSALMTAGHCMPPSAVPQAFIEIQVFTATGPDKNCISPGAGVCGTSGTGTANVFVQLDPNYDGTADYDQAVVITNPGWSSPANKSERWTAFPYNTQAVGNAQLTGTKFRIAGYGADAITNPTGGYSQRGNVTQPVKTMVGNKFQIVRQTASSPAVCEGDSGSGVHGTISPSTPFSLGIFSKFGIQQGLCEATNTGMVYSVPDGPWIISIVNYFGGTCAKQSGVFPFVKCW